MLFLYVGTFVFYSFISIAYLFLSLEIDSNSIGEARCKLFVSIWTDKNGGMKVIDVRFSNYDYTLIQVKR